jgi:hypothetical protein
VVDLRSFGFIAALTFGSVLLGLPQPGAAQEISGIAGVVKDASGAVLPGVTVEASSPALIERVRTVTSDGEGRFTIVDLRSGTYTVVFTLQGFTTVKREGIVIPAGFTATVNADLPVGTLSETITVSGSAPLVDIHSTTQGKVVTTEVLDALPNSAKSLLTIVSLTPGLNGAANVGGSAGIYGNSGNLGSFHGKSGYKVEIDGMSVLNTNYVGGSVGVVPSGFAMNEVQLETGGASAESSVNGVMTNSVPREGSNRWSGFIYTSGTGKSWESNNFDKDLETRGLREDTISKVLRLYDVNVGVGGPIIRDRLWFFDSSRFSGSKNQWAGSNWNATQGTVVFTAGEPGYRHENLEDTAVRLTWQVSTRNKVAAYINPQRYYVYGSTNSITNAPETVAAWHFKPQAIYQASWTSPVTSRLLLEAGSSTLLDNWRQFPSRKENNFNMIAITDSSRGFSYNAPSSNGLYDLTNRSDRWAQRASVSYITGSHAFKAGIQTEEGLNDIGTSIDHKIGFNGEYIPGNFAFTFNGLRPTSITEYATPFIQKSRILDLGLYAQDRWTTGRLTLNYGVRFDYFRGGWPDQHMEANAFIAERHYPAATCLPCWKDIDPRINAAYDLFGDGRTAVKVAVGRYPQRYGADIVVARNFLSTSINSVSRPWNDSLFGAGDPRTGNYYPDCDLSNPLQNGECNQISNLAFGQGNVVLKYADDIDKGWFKRQAFWDVSTEIQRELRAGVSVSGGYYSNWWSNFTKTDNLLVGPEDYSPFSIVAPVDPRLGRFSGATITGLYDINPDKRGQTDSLVVFDPDRKQRNDYFAAGINARIKQAHLSGGLDIGRRTDDNCTVVDSPGVLRNCRTVTAFRQGAQVKLNGSLPIKGGFVVSGVYQNVPGLALSATYTAQNSEVIGLGRNLSACLNTNPCTQTTSVSLIDPNTMWENRRSQLDLRITKLLRFTGSQTVRINFDAYNVFNANDVLSQTTAWGANWRKPSQILDGRLLQFSGQFQF